jgi:hypothetical protein
MNSAILIALQSSTVKLLVRQCLASRDSLCGVEVRHGANQIFGVSADSAPQREWSARIVSVESKQRCFENGNPGVVAKILQNGVHSNLVCKVGQLPFDHDSQRVISSSRSSLPTAKMTRLWTA